jgi:Fungal chitosanase of glycosyl hydrolase group 75
MFAPLIPIKIDSIYGGQPLPSRMAKCTPDMYAAIFAVKKELQSLSSDLVLSDLFRSYDMQYQAHQDWATGKKSAYSPPPGGSMHEAGRAFDLDLSKIKQLTLRKFWSIAAEHLLTPIVDQPDMSLNEAWHFDCRGSHQLVYDYYRARKGDNFQSPYSAMAASAILAVGQKVDVLGPDVHAGYVQSGLIRLGKIIGDLDGQIGPKTRTALAEFGIDPGAPVEQLSDAIDKKLQEAFPDEFFVPGEYIALQNVPEHLMATLLPTALNVLFPAAPTIEGYKPSATSISVLGSIVNKLTDAKSIQNNFKSKPKMLAQLPGGQIYFDSSLELDTDGWPGGGEFGDPDWQSGTSLRYESNESLNANSVPYFVLPLPTNWPAQFGISLGDYAAVVYKQTVAFAVFADFGPRNKLGEGSVQLLRQLGEERIRHGRVINAGMGPGVVTIVFPGSGARADRKSQTTLIDAISTKGRSLFSELGGQVV